MPFEAKYLGYRNAHDFFFQIDLMVSCLENGFRFITTNLLLSLRTYYYSRVALNYKDKLPLIFGKWKLLTDIFFGVGYLMRNFEPVFYKEIRAPLISLPLTMGGIKELYENMRGLAYHRYSKLAEIYESGEAAIDRISEADLSRMSHVGKKLFDIKFLLGSADLRKFIGYLTEQNFNSLTKSNVLTSIEYSFANEVSFLFYINLATKFAFLPQFRDEHIIPSRLYDYMSRGKRKIISGFEMRRDKRKIFGMVYGFNILRKANNRSYARFTERSGLVFG